MPPSFPVFSKPIMNLRGMGTGSQVDRLGRRVPRRADRRAFLVHAADRRACQHRRGAGGRRGALVAPHHRRDRTGRHVRPLADPCRSDAGDRGLVRRLGAHASCRGYTGMANFETIGGRIIEAHLRFADQWPDLYGPGWVEAVVRLHVTGDWVYPDADACRRLQRGAVRPARPALSPPAGRAGRRGARHARRVQRADHLPRGQGAGAPRHAARAASGWRSSTRSRWRPVGQVGRGCGRCCWGSRYGREWNGGSAWCNCETQPIAHGDCRGPRSEAT